MTIKEELKALRDRYRTTARHLEYHDDGGLNSSFADELSAILSRWPVDANGEPWALVPREPTDAMLDTLSPRQMEDGSAEILYREMISVAQQEPNP